MSSSHQKKKILIFRLSSLGDLILATAALETQTADPAHAEVDWVVAREFADLLRGHPKISKLHEFDRRGVKGGFDSMRTWIRLCRSLFLQEYDEVYDLHGSLRTRIAKWLFVFWNIFRGKGRRTKWMSESKQRARFYGYCVFKSWLPKAWRPQSLVYRHAKVLKGSGLERPNFRHFIQAMPSVSELARQSDFPSRFICVMPGARWDGKKWKAERFLEVIRSAKIFPVVLGTNSDRESVELAKRLKEEGLPHFSGVGIWDLRQTAWVLSQAIRYLGNDTGLGHLAEAVGTPVTVVFGPTAPDLGFGPWQPKSSVVSAGIWCQPCGKDGRACFRLGANRFKCMSALSAEQVVKAL